jgi:hypothetical protein
MDGARHVIEHIFSPRLLSQEASYDVASTIHQSLEHGAGHLALRPQLLR